MRENADRVRGDENQDCGCNPGPGESVSDGPSIPRRKWICTVHRISRLIQTVMARRLMSQSQRYLIVSEMLPRGDVLGCVLESRGQGTTLSGSVSARAMRVSGV